MAAMEDARLQGGGGEHGGGGGGEYGGGGPALGPYIGEYGGGGGECGRRRSVEIATYVEQEQDQVYTAASHTSFLPQDREKINHEIKKCTLFDSTPRHSTTAWWAW